ncbi:MAG TPA: hypothetical protein VEJ84_05290 [Acidimicrobiales bacterium]|nr:hypothetical protein [Acidimicrobiales bacterium]
MAVEAAPGLIFALLITPGRWEHDFSVIRKVRVAPPGGAALGPDSEFEFETNELRLYAQVIEFVADSRLAWSGQGTDISAYQAWVISGQATTPQVRAGFAARGAAAIALRETSVGGAQRTLDRWLADLRIAAETA